MTDFWENTIVKPNLKKPSMYGIVILNDDFTPMEFVVRIIMNVFNLPLDDATRIMLQVHKEGRGKIGSFTHEVAETKTNIIVDTARKNEFPLMAFPEML